MTAPVSISRDGRTNVLRLTRPEKMNALTAPMYKTLSDAIEAAEADPEISVHLIFGSGGVFSAGNDIGDFLATAEGTDSLRGEVLRFVKLLPVIDKPLIAAVDGKAIGIGTTLLFHCDLVYATETSTFATPFLDLGLIPEAASSLLAPRLMGYARAFELLVLGEVFTAARARDAGFVNAIVGAEQLEEKTLQAARTLAAKPPEALAIARRLMRGDRADVIARTNEEVVAFRQRLASDEAREAFVAFFEKRAPNFKR